jgi:ParB-like chromosome segregation protein Spo0J
MSDLNGKVIWIDEDQINPPDDPRECTDQETDDLAADIGKNQQLEPGMVEPSSNPGEGGKPWKMIFGWHRLKAIRKLGWKQMKCEVREGLTPLQRFQIILSENAKRSGASPFFQARLLQNMQAELKAVKPDASQKDLAESAGMNETDVSEYLAIGLIPDDLKAKFAAANFSFNRLSEVIRADNSDQLQAVSEIALRKSLSAEAIKSLVKKLRRPAGKATKGGDGAAKSASKLWPGFPEGVQFKSQARYHHLIWPEELYSKALMEQILSGAPDFIQVKRRQVKVAPAAAPAPKTEGGPIVLHIPETIPTPAEVRELLKGGKAQ